MEQAAVFSIGLDPAVSREIKRHSGWFVALGVALIVLGVVALGAVGLVTLASVLLFGWLLVIGGIMQSVHAFRVHPWGGFTRHLLGGVLSLVVGLLMVANPAAGALSLTLLLAAFFTVVGIFRIVATLSFRFPGRGRAVFGGLVTLLLGIMIWSEWPVSGVWVIGTFVGIDLIARRRATTRSNMRHPFGHTSLRRQPGGDRGACGENPSRFQRGRAK